MGPRLFRRGNSGGPSPSTVRPRWLQWGHAFSDVEIGAIGTRQHSPKAASMGPRLFRRGNRLPPLLLGEGYGRLQWGHAFSDVEIRERHLRPPASKSVLQWGHAFSDVEILERYERTRRLIACFNGATPFQTWKWNVNSYDYELEVGFNGATPFQTWKSGSRRSCPSHPLASMGPRLFRRGNRIGDDFTVRSLPARLQWGHAFSDVEI